MSLGLVIKAPEGIVLAAESRVTLSVPTPNNGHLHVNFDNAVKLLDFHEPNSFVGGITYGQATIELRTAHSFIPEFETSLPAQRLSIIDFATQLSNFYMEQWNASTMPKADQWTGADMTFNIAGYNEGEPYGIIYSFSIPRAPLPVPLNPGGNQFSVHWGGQREVVDRLIMGYDSRLIPILQGAGVDMGIIAPQLQTLQLNIAIQFMPLQDCIDLVLLFIKTTINTQKLTVGLRGCGGPIDVAVITRTKPLQFIQRKELKGEQIN